MKISIAMATYNGAEYLQQQLDSFIAQTRQPDELVVCDDGSSDATLFILHCFAQKAPFEVHIYQNEANLGYAKNFEKAISLCSGDIIFLSDQDDYWFREKIAILVGWMEDHPSAYLVQSNMELVNSDLRPTGVTQLGNILALGGCKNDFMFGCGMAFRYNWLEIVLPIPKALWGHDNWIHRLAILLEVAGLYESPLMYYRRHNNNASRSLSSRTTQLSQWASFQAHGLGNATAGWRNEVQRLCDLQQRLKEKSEYLEKAGLGEAVLRALNMLKQRESNLEARINCVSQPRWRRMPSVMSLWGRGGYRQFSGLKSMVKDLIRP